MDQIRSTGRGEDAEKLRKTLREFDQDKRTDDGEDGFALIGTDRFFHRITARAQTILVFELVDATMCMVTAIAGGVEKVAKHDFDVEGTAAW